MTLRRLFNRRIQALVFSNALLFGPWTSFGQNTSVPAYQGANPELIDGIEPYHLAFEQPKVRHVYVAAPDVLALVVDAQAMLWGTLTPYVPEPGDKIVRERPQPYGQDGKAFYWQRSIVRNGKILGNAVGPKEDHYVPPKRLVGQPIDLAWLDSASSYTVRRERTVGEGAMTPLSVSRKSRPLTNEWTVPGKQEGTAQHEVFLKLPEKLVPGTRYEIIFNGGNFAGNLSVLFDDHRLRTEALSVNQNGYHPKQSQKQAFMFLWTGKAGGMDYSRFTEFLVVEHRSGRPVYQGQITLAMPGDPTRRTADENTRDESPVMPASLYLLDFSDFSTEGEYRIVVAGLGTSFPFRIGTSVFTDAAKVAAHGFFNQRSGMALTAPYTKFLRPRALHPEDGVPIYDTDPALFFSTSGDLNNPNNFQRIQKSLLESKTVPEAWGGWHDAGDYDRSVLPQNHMRAVHAMLELYEANPRFFGRLTLNLPESGNNLPDILDEALWCMELFRRTQRADGSIVSAVESIEHPSEPSWMLAQPTATTPATPQSCHAYAGAAARLSIALRRYAPSLADAYRSSAERAMRWAAENATVPNVYARSSRPVEEHANLAAAWMFELTGSEEWHREFKRTLQELDALGRLEIARFNEYTGPWGFAVYAASKQKGLDESLLAKCRDAVVRAANVRADRVLQAPLGQTPVTGDWGYRLGIGWELILAHKLTGNVRYQQALERMVQYPLGLNPLNSTFITGVGSRQVWPFHLDAYYLGQAFPEGLTTFGPAPRSMWGGARTEVTLNKAGLYPEWEYWPWAESYFNLRILYNFTEYAVGGVLANRLMTLGYLAQELEDTTP